MSGLEETVRHVLGLPALRRFEIAVVGGLAVSAHTEPRFTRAVDLCVAVDDDASAESLVRELRDDGYESGPDATPKKAGRLPPRVVVVGAWYLHRAIHRVTGGRRGLWRYTPDGKWGTFVLHTVGRRSGREREAILGYIEDGPNLVTMAMNGWADPEPSWWLNLQARPDATVDLTGGETRAVHARAAEGEERERLLERFAQSESNDLNAYMARRSRQTAIVVLEPR